MSDWNKTALKEPSLDELLAEPMIQQLMKRDGVHAQEMQHHFHRSMGQSQSHRRF